MSNDNEEERFNAMISLKKTDHPLSIKELFFVSMICGIIFYVIVALFSSGKTILYSLFWDPNDVFMDFFHSAYDALKPYEESSVIYPPFINVIFRIIGTMMAPFAYDAFSARSTVIGGMLFAIFVILTVFAFYLVVKYYYNGKKKDLLVLLLLLSMPFLFCLERGNVVIVAALLIFPFILWYDSENGNERFVAFLCLAISVNIKMYPIIFCLLLLRKKQYKDFLWFILMTAIIFFGSLLILQDSLIDFVVNIFDGPSTIGGIGISNIVFNILYVFGLQSYTKIVSISIMAIVIVVSVYVILKISEIKEWKIVLLLSLILCTCGTFNSFYCLTYMFIPLMMFLNAETVRSRDNMIYLIAFLLMMIPMIGFNSTIFNTAVGISMVVNYVLPTLILLYLLITTIKTNRVIKTTSCSNDIA